MLYNNKVAMLTIHEKVNSEMGLRNRFIIFVISFIIEFQDLVSAKIENQEGDGKAYDAAYTYIRQEMLRKVDA